MAQDRYIEEDGYDIPIVIEVLEGGGNVGAVIVLNNNDNAYLVALRDAVCDTRKVMVIQTFLYENEMEAKIAYMQALALATATALRY